MSRNGAGTYTLVAGNPVVTGSVISSTWANNTLNDIATALTTSIAYDGQTTIVANLPMAGFKLTGLGAGNATGNSLRYEQLFSTAGINLLGAINDTISTVASATAPDIWTANGNVINYTGTVTATGFAAAPQAGTRRTLICAGAAVFTAGANMLIDGTASASNFTAKAGDKIDVIAFTTTQFYLCPRPIVALPTAFKVINTTFDMTSATGTFAITGVGFKPRRVDIMAGFTAGSSSGCECTGWSDGTNESSNFNIIATPGSRGVVTSQMGTLSQGGTGNQTLSIATGGSFDVDGCTIRNVKTSSPTGTVNLALYFSR